MNNSQTVTVDLGAFGPRVRERLESGEFESASEVVQAGLEALEQAEARLAEDWRAKIKESLDDPRPDVPMEEVFDRLEKNLSARMKAAGHGS